MQKFISIDPMEPGTVFESTGLLHSGSSDDAGGTTVIDVDYVAPSMTLQPSPTAASSGGISAFEVGRASEASVSGAGGAVFSPMGLAAQGGVVPGAATGTSTGGSAARKDQRGMKEPKSMKLTK